MLEVGKTELTRPENIDLTHKMFTREFEEGWDAALEKVRKIVTDYIEAVKDGETVDPWECFLPRLLDDLAAND
jgi:hypothetical protein